MSRASLPWLWRGSGQSRRRLGKGAGFRSYPWTERSGRDRRPIGSRFSGPGEPLLPHVRSRLRVCRHCLTEIFLLLGCADPVCCHAAPRTVEGFLLFLGRKALNLCKAKTVGPSACATAVANHAGCSSARAVGCTLPLMLLLLERPLGRQRLGPCPPVRSRACPGCLASAARAPRIGQGRNRCHADPPHAQARRSARILASG